MNPPAAIENQESEIFPLMLPGEDGWASYQFKMLQGRAKILSDNGWRFIQADCPRGIYYEGFGPGGARVMSEQQNDPEAALLAAINHAFTVQFPWP